MSRTQGTTSRSLYLKKKKYMSLQVCASYSDTLCNVRINQADCLAISFVFVAFIILTSTAVLYSRFSLDLLVEHR